MDRTCEICKKTEATHKIVVYNNEHDIAFPIGVTYTCRDCIPKMRMEIKSEQEAKSGS